MERRAWSDDRRVEGWKVGRLEGWMIRGLANLLTPSHLLMVVNREGLIPLTAKRLDIM